MVPKRYLLGIYLFFFSIYLLSANGHFHVIDHLEVYRTTKSLIENGSLAIEPSQNTAPAPGGKAYSPYGVGQSVVSIPLYLLGRWVAGVGSSSVQRYFARLDVEAPEEAVTIFFVSLLNQVVTPLICAVVFLFVLQLGFPPLIAFLVSLELGLGTQLWVYATQYFQHPLETLFVLLSVYGLFCARRRLALTHTLAAGAALGLAILTRPSVVMIVPLVVAYLVLVVRGYRAQRLFKRLALSVIAFGLPVLASLGVTLYLNLLKYGHPLNFGPQTAPGFSTPLWVGLYGYLFSVGRSLFLYSPPLVMTLLTLGQFYRRHRLETALLGALVVMYLVVYSSFTVWHGGWSWGPRYLLPTLPFLSLPLAYTFGDRPKLVLSAVLLACGMGVQFLGLVVNFAPVYWEWIQMPADALTPYLFVPQLSSIPTHLDRLIRQQANDLWLAEVYRQFGLPVFLATLAVPLLLFGVSIYLLRHLAGLPTPDRARETSRPAA